MVQELDTVVLTHDVSGHRLKKGDIGAVVHRYSDGKAFDVEFVTETGQTTAVVSLAASDIRPGARGRYKIPA